GATVAWSGRAVPRCAAGNSARSGPTTAAHQDARTRLPAPPRSDHAAAPAGPTGSHGSRRRSGPELVDRAAPERPPPEAHAHREHATRESGTPAVRSAGRRRERVALRPRAPRTRAPTAQPPARVRRRPGA